jgi:hypothetical protein
MPWAFAAAKSDGILLKIVLMLVATPRLQLPARLRDDPFADGDDQTGFFPTLVLKDLLSKTGRACGPPSGAICDQAARTESLGGRLVDEPVGVAIPVPPAAWIRTCERRCGRSRANHNDLGTCGAPRCCGAKDCV